MGISQAQVSGLIIHQFCEAFHGTAAIDGQCHGGIVAGGKHQTIQQLLKCQHFPLLQVHGGTFDAYSFLGNPHSVQDIALFADDQCRHDFRGAGNETAFLGILLI